MQRLITLLTDFGTADGYVGEMKGVLASLAPGATIVDVAHEVAPHDVDGARLALARYWQRFPEGTVHLVVVDPGVGSVRAALATSSEGRFLVGPDNGVLSPALLLAGARAVQLAVPPTAAPTWSAPARSDMQLVTALPKRSMVMTSPRMPPSARRCGSGVRRITGSSIGCPSASITWPSRR